MSFGKVYSPQDVDSKDDLWDIPPIVQIGSLEDKSLPCQLLSSTPDLGTAHLGHADASNELEEMVDIFSLLIPMFTLLRSHQHHGAAMPDNDSQCRYS